MCSLDGFVVIGGLGWVVCWLCVEVVLDLSLFGFCDGGYFVFDVVLAVCFETEACCRQGSVDVLPVVVEGKFLVECNVFDCGEVWLE